MFFEWLSQNIGSILVLLGVIAFIGLLTFSLIRGHIKAKSSPNPGCYGCPNAKSCAGHCHTPKSTEEKTSE